MKRIYKIVGLSLLLLLFFKSCRTKTQSTMKDNEKSIEDSISEKKRKLKEKFQKMDVNKHSEDEAPPINQLEVK